jgi:hypothetical protein
MVAIATFHTAEVLMPARIAREAIGSSTRRRRAQAGRPSAAADSRRDGATSASPVAVLLTIGRRL